MSKNPNAQALASLAKGKPKRFTPADIERRRAQMKANQAKRWAGHVKKAAVLLILSTFAAAEPWKPTSTALDQPGSTSLATSGAATIAGLVIQRTSAGLLIKTSKRGDGGHVWLRGYDAKVGQRITVRAVKGEPEEFATTGGAARMIDGYDAQ
jgi:hypothetical protein